MATKKRRRRRRSQAARGLAPALIAVLVIIFVVIGMAVSYLVERYSPSDEYMDLTEYYSLAAEDEVAIVLNNEVIEAKGKQIDGEVYVTTDTLYDSLNSRFYWDSQENKLLYTTPTELITADVGSNTYTVAKNEYTESYAPVKVEGDTAYVALAYIQKYTGMLYDLTTDANGISRVTITTEFGTVETVTAKKNACVRYRAGIKSDILTDVAKGDTLYVLTETEDVGEWTKVRTGDGCIGYIQNKFLGSTGEETLESNYTEPEYTSLTKDYTINMAWHQVTNSDANSTVLETIANTKGLTTISPTWFFLCDDEGDIESLASSTYVNYCHQNDIEVWGLVEDITYKDTIKDYNILSRTSSRQRLVNNLIAKAIEYDLDGINVDFEYINAESAKGYLEFLRELSIMCRLNGIILSVDNYVPMASSYYGRQEQGIVADYVVMMGYDEHYAGSEEAGSVASIGWVRAGLEATLAEVPSEKVILAVPFYTRLWQLRELSESEIAQQGTGSDTSLQYEVTSKAYGMDALQKILDANGVTPTWDEESGQYYAEYEADGYTYKVWMEEEESIAVKAALLSEYNLAGISAWKLGYERSTIWDIILKYVN